MRAQGDALQIRSRVPGGTALTYSVVGKLCKEFGQTSTAECIAVHSDPVILLPAILARVHNQAPEMLRDASKNPSSYLSKLNIQGYNGVEKHQCHNRKQALLGKVSGSALVVFSYANP